MSDLKIVFFFTYFTVEFRSKGDADSASLLLTSGFSRKGINLIASNIIVNRNKLKSGATNSFIQLLLKEDYAGIEQSNLIKNDC